MSGNGSHTMSPSPTNTTNEASRDATVEQLQEELAKAREEKDALAAQYNSLLAKLTDMRTKLGSKLKQDAEELDRREQLIESLTVQNEDLSTTLETLKEELIASHAEADRTSAELDGLRTRTYQDNAQESLQRERELREAQLELETCRMERDEWERMALHEKAMSEEFKSSADSLRRDLELEKLARQRESTLLDEEREKTSNLQSVLMEFQTSKDHELRQATKDYEAQVLQVTQALAEYKHRAHTAELKLDENESGINRTQELEKELKEKNLLIGKLRHETVIINEHLVEALRRLRRNSSETNVDRRLVTNVILSFITTPRADSKRFEMLKLLASILSWTDQEREKAGLQRGSHGDAVHSPPASGFWGRTLSSGGGAPSPTKGPSSELPKSDETESFSRLWVEFLLTEAGGEAAANGAGGAKTTTNGTVPGSPQLSRQSLSTSRTSLSPPKLSRPLASPSSSSGDLGGLVSPSSRKGKEREHF